MEELLEGMKSQASGFFPTPDGIASEPLTRLTMFAFGFGGVGQYIYSLVLGFFMLPFLLEVRSILLSLTLEVLTHVASGWWHLGIGCRVPAIGNQHLGCLREPVRGLPIRQVALSPAEVLDWCWYVAVRVGEGATLLTGAQQRFRSVTSTFWPGWSQT